LGIERIAMLTGDNPAAAQSVADALELEDVRSGLLPADKVAAIREIQRSAGPVAMVGDGINDAPSLVAADVGVAMAEIGTDVAISSADVVLVGDDLSKLIDAIDAARRMLKIIWQNILGAALVFNVLAVAAASLGWISPVAAAVLHQVSSLAVVLNSLRLLIEVDRWRHRWGHFVAALRRRRRLLGATAGAAAALTYGLSGWHVVGVGQVAVVRHFGKVVLPIEEPGMHFRLPYPFGSHTVVMPDEVRRVEIGFRTLPGSFTEPAAYEWNVQHRGGRHEARPEEATLLAGDESLADVNLVVHYRVADPLPSLFHVGRLAADGSSKWDVLVRNLAEAALRAEMSARPADDVLGFDRIAIETRVRDRVAEALAAYRAGLEVETVCLGDVHPPWEVVPAFREVASALEEKEAKINEAEAYQFETEALAEGEAKTKVLSAEGFRQDRVDRARGQAARFIAVAEAYDRAPDVTGLRLHLETVEKTLAGRRKVIVDSTAGGARRQLFLGSKGVLGLMPTQPPAGDSFPKSGLESEP
jgi:HflK protein